MLETALIDSFVEHHQNCSPSFLGTTPYCLHTDENSLTLRYLNEIGNRMQKLENLVQIILCGKKVEPLGTDFFISLKVS